MNAKTHFSAAVAVAALALIGTSAAFADEVRDYPTPSTLTRAEVLADLARARANGDTLAEGESYGNVQPFALAQRSADGKVIGLSRVEVRNELARARADGSLQVAGESYGNVTPGTSTRTRAEVRAEAIADMHSRVITQYRGL
jgi:hypothetical protein